MQTKAQSVFMHDNYIVNGPSNEGTAITDLARQASVIESPCKP